MTSQLLNLAYYHAIIVVAVSLFARFLFSLYKNRRRMLALEKEGLVSIMPLDSEAPWPSQRSDWIQCMPPYNPLFGHLLEARGILF